MIHGRKMRVAIVFGGKSGEHEVSLASARSIMKALDKDRYDILPVGITKSGCWLTKGDPMAFLSSAKDAAEDLESARHSTGGHARDIGVAKTGRRDLVPGTTTEQFPEVDVVFPVLHGPFGEDGTVQGLFELADLPYVGAGVLGSALGLDKVAQKAVLAANGLPIVDYVEVKRSRWQSASRQVVAEIESQLSYPVFVKPANLGSSVGVSKAREAGALCRGLDLAARFDRKLLVERAVDAREIECSVLGNDVPIASVPGEVVPSNEFYDYRAKYLDDASVLHIPAELPEGTTELVRELAIKAFLALDCAGMARVDFFLCRATGRVYVNELNTIPGFTNISMYPKLWEASGLPYPELLNRLIELAIERHKDQSESETFYSHDH